MKRLFGLAAPLLCTPLFAMAQTATPIDLSESLFQDHNGNGTLEVAAFGDSITRGVGDFSSSGESGELYYPPPGQEAGYPLRVETRLGIGVSNLGDPGEVLAYSGLERFASTIPGLRPDVVIISEGANDARFFISPSRYWRALQTAINIAQASGVTPILSTLIPTSSNHQFQRPAIESYNSEIRRLGIINGLPVIEFDRAFRNTCEISTCTLINQPDGLHPNTFGYDVMGETVLAAVLGIDLFAADGAQQLEAALALPAGTVITRPDPSAPPPSGEGAPAAEGEESGEGAASSS